MKVTFWNKYKVFLLGLAGAIAVSLQEFLTNNTEANVRVYAFAALMAALSYVATQWRGKGVTIFGIVGTLAGVFVTMQQTGTFTWTQFIYSAIAAVLAAVSSPPKPSSYEHNEAIVEAKQIPAIDQVPLQNDLKQDETDIRNR